MTSASGQRSRAARITDPIVRPSLKAGRTMLMVKGQVVVGQSAVGATSGAGASATSVTIEHPLNIYAQLVVLTHHLKLWELGNDAVGRPEQDAGVGRSQHRRVVIRVAD